MPTEPPKLPKQPPPPHFHRQDHASLIVEDPRENLTHREERDEEEYYFVHHRHPSSEASESATINFMNDDRMDEQLRYKRSSTPFQVGKDTGIRVRIDPGEKSHARYEYEAQDHMEIAEVGSTLNYALSFCWIPPHWISIELPLRESGPFHCLLASTHIKLG